MVVGGICSSASLGFLSSSLYPLLAIAGTVTAIIIALAYAIGEVTSNPKMSLWSKTEIFQLIASMVCCVILLQIITVFCLLDVRSIYSLFTNTVPATSLTIYDAADHYFIDAGTWTSGLLRSARYHLGSFFVLQNFGRSTCEDMPAEIRWLFCIFGTVATSSASGGISVSVNTIPDSGYGLLSSGLFVSFNSILFALLSLLNYTFILRYLYGGFILLFLPLGMMLRSMPFMRQIGSLLIAVAISFAIIYPLVLSVFYIDFLQPAPVRILTPCSSAFLYSNEDLDSKVDLSDAFDLDGTLYDDLFSTSNDQTICGTAYASGEHGDQTFEIIKLTANAFLIGVFIPSLSLLASAAAVSYANRFLGQEIDLSRIVQMV
ncbi:hypothetical protein HY990_00850 [Candidatus Micrarchaeota archaeon]|nr:hypothetical protein [Candidatus Micrarchaeota archaeon]